jgi:hypothetical protein
MKDEVKRLVRPMRYLAALTTSLICLQAIAHAAEKKPAAAAYTQRIGAIVNRLIDSELTKHVVRLNAFSVKLRYHVDRYGRVQRMEIISAKPDRTAADMVTRLIKSTTFPPFPKDLLREGADFIVGELDWTWSGLKADDATGRPRTFIRVQTHPEPHSCVLAIAAIDGKSLPLPLKEVSLSPGRHRLAIRVWLGAADRSIVHADAPLDQSFKPHRYWIDGELSKTGLLRLVVEDEDERPPGVKRAKTK